MLRLAEVQGSPRILVGLVVLNLLLLLDNIVLEAHLVEQQVILELGLNMTFGVCAPAHGYLHRKRLVELDADQRTGRLLLEGESGHQLVLLVEIGGSLRHPVIRAGSRLRQLGLLRLHLRLE